MIVEHVYEKVGYLCVPIFEKHTTDKRSYCLWGSGLFSSIPYIKLIYNYKGHVSSNYISVKEFEANLANEIL